MSPTADLPVFSISEPEPPAPASQATDNDSAAEPIETPTQSDSEGERGAGTKSALLKQPRPKLRHRLSSRLSRIRTAPSSATISRNASSTSLARIRTEELRETDTTGGKHRKQRAALDQRKSRTGMSLTQIYQLPWNVIWRTGLVRLPRAVPVSVLRYTCPEGPQPNVLNMPSRSKGRMIPCYVFVPPTLTEDPSQPAPVVVDFHGGGFFLGSCLEQAPWCALLARELGAVVISVDYRMGPIDKFPAAVHDGEDIISAILDPTAPGYNELRQDVARTVQRSRKIVTEPTKVQLDATRVAVSGFSSGGNLALNMGIDIAGPPALPEAWPSRFGRDYKHPIPLLLYYPSLDLRQLPSERTRPPKLPLSKGMLSDLGDQLAPTYCPRDQTSNPRASPGLAPIANGGIHEQARMLLVLPELDNLAEQSEVWVEMVAREGRGQDVQVERYPGLKHGWTQMPESWLNEEERATRLDALTKGVEFARDVWAGRGANARVEGKSDNMPGKQHGPAAPIQGES